MADVPKDVKLAMAGVELSNALIAFLINEGIIDKNRLADWLNSIVEDKKPDERGSPSALTLAHVAKRLASDRPDWFRGVFEGGPPDDETTH